MVVVHAMLGAVDEDIMVVYVEMDIRVFVLEWIPEDARAMPGAADEAIVVAYVAMVTHVCVIEKRGKNRSNIR